VPRQSWETGCGVRPKGLVQYRIAWDKALDQVLIDRCPKFFAHKEEY
jgi:hypothetical protein